MKEPLSTFSKRVSRGNGALLYPKSCEFSIEISIAFETLEIPHGFFTRLRRARAAYCRIGIALTFPSYIINDGRSRAFRPGDLPELFFCINLNQASLFSMFLLSNLHFVYTRGRKYPKKMNKLRGERRVLAISNHYLEDEIPR